ncbi:DUF4382 domain-containing protein [Antarcticibacterium flavum]|nr:MULTISPECIES: DUF4382 domain-containing protein [Antarcticibacterium]
MKMFSGKLKLRKFAGLLLAAVALTSFYSCSDDDDNNLEEDTARLTVRMTDAPGDYDAVFVEVEDVMIKSDLEAEGEGWVSVGNVQTGIYDLLELTGGVTQLLAEAEVPAGHLGQIRLVLGNNNSVVINGESQPLSTPSAQQSGLKLQVNQELEAGEQYEFLLDFDVDQSIVTAGSSGGFILKPVIRVSATAETGMIIGEVHPSAVGGLGIQTVVKATNASHTISAYTDANGAFVLNGVPSGTYQITVTPEAASGLSAKTMSNVEVSSNATVDLETIFLD